MDDSDQNKSLASPEIVANLSEGLLETYQKPLEKVSDSLKELTTKQKILIEAVEAQNVQLQNCQSNDEVKIMIGNIISCRDRLISIKRQMLSIHERSNKLRIRSQNVLNKANTRHTTRIQELEREQKLIGGQKSAGNS